MNKLSFISVIIPCRNEEKHIETCLNSLLENDYPKDKIEILVVDGMSDDSARSIIKRYAGTNPFIKLLDNPRKITPCALNIGIKNANGDVIIRIDTHSAYEKDYISKCCEILYRVGADNVGGSMRAVGTDKWSKAIAFAHNSLFGLGGGKFHNMKFEGNVDTVYLGCWRKNIFEKYGLFDERLVRNQDIEHNARIRKNGGKVFLTPAIKSSYFCRSNLKDLWIQNFRNGYWNIKTMKIAPGSLSTRHFIPLLFVLSLLIAWIIPWLWLGIVASYLLCNFYFSIEIAVANGIKYFFLMPLVFTTLHVSSGLGLLSGILRVKKE